MSWVACTSALRPTTGRPLVARSPSRSSNTISDQSMTEGCAGFAGAVVGSRKPVALSQSCATRSVARMFLTFDSDSESRHRCWLVTHGINSDLRIRVTARNLGRAISVMRLRSWFRRGSCRQRSESWARCRQRVIRLDASLTALVPFRSRLLRGLLRLDLLQQGCSGYPPTSCSLRHAAKLAMPRDFNAPPCTTSRNSSGVARRGERVRSGVKMPPMWQDRHHSAQQLAAMRSIAASRR